MTDDENITRLRNLYAHVDIPQPPPFGVRGDIAAPRSRRWSVGVAMAVVVLVATMATIKLSDRRPGVAAPRGARVVVTDDLMTPRFLAGDVVNVQAGSVSKLKLGDLVVIRTPAPERIRRVVGMPGDRVQLRGGVLVRNGHPVPPTDGNGGGRGASSTEHLVDAMSYAVLPDDHSNVTGEADWWMVSTEALKPMGSWTVSTELATVIDATRPPELLAEPSAGVDVQRVVEDPLPIPGLLPYVVIDQRNGFVKVELHDRQTQGVNGWHMAKRAWIRATAVKIGVVAERIEVDLVLHRLSVVFANGTSLVTQVAVGKALTPTPRGRVQILELRRRLDTDVYGPGELRTSGRSDVYRTYLGDDPYLIAVQGNNDTSAIGKAVTNGNIRVRNDVWLKLATLPLGTPVIIR